MSIEKDNHLIVNCEVSIANNKSFINDISITKNSVAYTVFFAVDYSSLMLPIIHWEESGTGNISKVTDFLWWSFTEPGSLGASGKAFKNIFVFYGYVENARDWNMTCKNS